MFPNNLSSFHPTFGHVCLHFFAHFALHQKRVRSHAQKARAFSAILLLRCRRWACDFKSGYRFVVWRQKTVEKEIWYQRAEGNPKCNLKKKSTYMCLKRIYMPNSSFSNSYWPWKLFFFACKIEEKTFIRNSMSTSFNKNLFTY